MYVTKEGYSNWLIIFRIINEFKEVANPYFEKKFENFINATFRTPKTLIYSIFIVYSYFLKNLKIPPKTAN